MKIKYFKFQENIFKELENIEDSLIIFNDYFSKNNFLKYRQKNIIKYQSKVITLDELKREIFITDKMILTEAKRPLSLYNSLSDEVKEELRVKTYYDIIDIADLFFKFYKELKINLIEKLDENILYDWQIDKINLFNKMKLEYDEYLLKNKMIPSDWIENISNLDTSFFENYKKIILIDIPYFSPLLKNILEEISKDTEINIYIQGSKDIYNEAEIKISNINFKKNLEKNTKIKIHEVKSDLEESLSLLYLLNKNEKKLKVSNIYSPKLETNIYPKILPKYFISNKMKTLDETEIYKFMNLQKDILASLEIKRGWGIQIESLGKALENERFCRIYGIDSEAKLIFEKIFSKEYRYLNPIVLIDGEINNILISTNDVLKSKITGIFNKIYTDILEINKYKTIGEFYIYFNNLGFENFKEEEDIDVLEKIHEIFFSVKSSETLFGNFKSISKGSRSQFLYTLIIKYMEGIEVKTIPYQKEELLKGIIKNIDESRFNYKERSYYVDINNNSYPLEENKHFLFTDKQLEKLGYQSSEEKINIKKYRFLQSLNNSDENIIFYKKDNLNKIDKSIFLEEIILDNDLKVEDDILSEKEILEILSESLSQEKGYEIEGEKKEISKKDSNLLNEEAKISLGIYDVISLEKCQYKYFLKNIGGLEPPKEEVYGTSLSMLGTITHKIFEEVSSKVYYKIINSKDFQVDEEVIDKIILKIKKENIMKLPVYIEMYFDKVILMEIRKSIKIFYKKLEEELKDEEIRSFFSEKSKKYQSDYNDENKNLPDIILKGRLDLIIEGSKNNYIIDYKTGGKEDKQLDLYSILAYGDVSSSKKIIYNVLDKTFVESTKEKINKESLNEVLYNLVNEEYYSRAELKSICRNCEYSKICRKEACEIEEDTKS